MKRKLLQWLTLALFALCVWTAYANVLSDDTEVRVKAVNALEKMLGEKIELEHFRGDRGMIEETIEYEVRKKGRFVVTCRRPYIAFGEHVCVVTTTPQLWK